MAIKQFITDLSPTECLERMDRKRDKKPCPWPDFLRRKYKSFFTSRKQSEGDHVYIDVKNNGFEAYITSWGLMAVKSHVSMATYKKYIRLQGTVYENEVGGSIVEYRIKPSISYGFFILSLIVLLGLLFGLFVLRDYILVFVLVESFPLFCCGWVMQSIYKDTKNLQCFIRDLLEAKNDEALDLEKCSPGQKIGVK